MTSLTRWKLASLLLAGLAGYALFLRGPAADDVPASEATHSRDGSIPAHFRRPLRISAEAAGISKAELVDRLLAAKTVRDVQVLAEKLAIVGDDETIRDVRKLLSDPRRGVPEAVLGAIGKIGTERAVDLLIDYTQDDRPAVRNAAILALGTTQSRGAEKTLVAIAQKPGSAQPTAIAALGQHGGDKAIRVLGELARGHDFHISSPAIVALGAVSSRAGDAELRSLIDAPDPRVAGQALLMISTIDDDLTQRLKKLAKSNDIQLAMGAVSALARAGETALPTLREVALDMASSARYTAVHSIATIGGPTATKMLGELLEQGDRQVAASVAGALAGMGGQVARELLINSALSDRASITGAVAQLLQLEGEDVDAALLKIVKDGSNTDRKLVLPRLIKAGNEHAMQIAIDIAQKGSRNERVEAMRMLADSPSPKAWDTLIDLAGKTRGATRVAVLDMLATKRPSDPAVEALLADSLFSGRKDEAVYAAGVLGRMKSEQATQTLITAMQGSDKDLAFAAATALASQQGMSERVKTLLLAAARDNEQIKVQVMHQLLTAGAPEGLRLADEVLSGNGAHIAGVMHLLAANGSAEAKRLIERAIRSADPTVKMAAIATLATNPDDRSTDTLIGLTRDDDPQVRATAIGTLGQVGSLRAQQAIMDAARSSRVEDKMAAIGGLATIDDPRAAQQLSQLMRDADKNVALTAIASGYNGGAEIDRTLVSIVNDPNAGEELRIAAAGQLRGRGTDLDDATEQAVTQRAGSAMAYGGYGYAGLAMPEEAPAIDL